MPVKKIYDWVETEAAIERADRRNINQLKLVRNDVSVTDWGKVKLRPSERNPSIPESYRYPGKRDEGHVFRRVEGTHEAGKSTYQDHKTAVAVTCQLLNSDAGQRALAELDGETRDLYDNTTKRVTSPVSGAWYGRRSDGAPWEKIALARCELMKLRDLLWVHSSYPYRFQVDGG